MKDVELGTLDLPRALLESGQVNDQWFPLMPSQTLNAGSGLLAFTDIDEDSINKMCIRVKAEYKVVFFFPSFLFSN